MWQPVNLAAPEFAVRAEPPSVCGILYAGARHVLSGPPEATKTLLAYVLALAELRAGGVVAIVDFEMGPSGARTLLDDLDATLDEISAIMFFEPTTVPTIQDIQTIVDAGVTLAIIDAAAGAYDVSDLDDNARKDAEKFARAWIRPLWQHGITSLLIDHVTKNVEARSRYAIGSERKLGQADVHLGLEVIGEPLHRGSTGHVKVRVHKDRRGHLERPYVAELHLESDPDTHRITTTVKPAEPATSTDGFRPTVLMQRVAGYLAEHGSSSRKTIEQAKLGKQAKFVRDAIDALIADGYATETIGARGARITTLLRPYTPTSSDVVSPRLDEDDATSSTSSPPQGGTRSQTRSSDEHDDNDLVRLEALGNSLGLTTGKPS